METIFDEYIDVGIAPFEEHLRNKIIDAICDAVPTSRIYVFGSRAKGNPRDDSDLDLYVVTLRDGDRHHDAIEIRKSLLWLYCDKDVGVISERALANYLKDAPQDGFIRHEVLERGILLFDARSEGKT